MLVDAAVVADVRDRLDHVLGFRLATMRRIDTGTTNNNRLLYLQAEDGREVLAKLYYRDQRQRLEREFGALAFLHEHRVRRVPTPLLRCDEHYYAVYSFEVGAPAPASAYTTAHAVDLARCAVDLHQLRPAGTGAALPRAVGSFLSVDQHVEAIRQQMQPFRAIAADGAAPAAVRALCAELDPVAAVERLVTAATADLAPAQYGARPEADLLRLHSGDFAPHNVLVRPDGGVCVVDFESAGWDHPLALCVDFVTHDQSLALGQEQVDAFLHTYRAASDLPEAVWARFDRACALRHVFWCTVHLGTADPAVVTRKRFANPTLDPDGFLANQLARFRRRLALAEDAVQQFVDTRQRS